MEDIKQIVLNLLKSKAEEQVDDGKMVQFDLGGIKKSAIKHLVGLALSAEKDQITELLQAHVSDIADLIKAVQKIGIEKIKDLLEAVDVNIKDELGSTALYHPSLKGNTEVVNLLLRAGADINSANTLGETLLHWAAAGGRGENSADFSCRRLNAVDIFGRSCLHWAAYYERQDIVESLASRIKQ